MKHRRLAAVLTACTTLAFAAGFAGTHPASAADKPITVAVGVDPSFAPFFVAQAKGLFKKHGLDVDIQQYANAGEAADALVARSADVAGVPAFNLLIRAPRAPLNAIGVFAEGKGDYVKVAAAPGITNPDQIKRIGVVPGTFSQYAADRFIQAFHLDAAKISIVRAGPPEMPELLHQGRIDAFILWNPWPARAEALGAKILMPIGQFHLHFLTTVTVRQAWLQDHREQARKLLAALSEATTMVNADPEMTAAVTKKAAQIPEAFTKQAVEQIDFRVRELDAKDRTNFENMLDFLQRQKILQAKPSLDALIVHGLVPNATNATPAGDH
ncbi:MAG TPA: ABC transporter substrate-binding protein [Nevskiaceae bacterium]